MQSSFCKLCLTHVADKSNSHIVPKFMGKGLFEETHPRRALVINRQGKGRIVQDTPKEDFILCTQCEKKIEILETLFASVIREIHQYKSLHKKFTLSQLGTQQYIECVSVHPTIFKLFIYSIIWRASVSNLIEYSSFRLDKQHEERIRDFLNLNLTTSKIDLIQNADKITNIPLYHSCVIKPKDKSKLSRGVFSVCSMSATAHILLLVDFVIFFYTDETSIGNVLERFSNKQNEKVIITLGETTPWLDLNRFYLSKLLTDKKDN